MYIPGVPEVNAAPGANGLPPCVGAETGSPQNAWFDNTARQE